MSYRRFLTSLLAAVLLLSAVPAAAHGKPPQHSRSRTVVEKTMPANAAMPGHVIVRVDAAHVGPDRRAIAKAIGVPPGLVDVIGPGVARVRLPKGTSRARFLRELSTDADVANAEPDHLRTPLYTPPLYSAPNDPYYVDSQTIESGYYNGDTFVATGVYPHGRSWWLRELGLEAPGAWSTGFTGTDASGHGLRAPADDFPVAVIDSGLFATHPDVGAGIVPKLDCLDTFNVSTGIATTDSDLTPPAESTLAWIVPDYDSQVRWTSHGTVVAGQVAAATNNALGVASAGYDARVYAYKVFGVITGEPLIDGGVEVPVGGSYIMDSAVIQAIYEAIDDGARVLNLSLGGAAPSDELQYAINEAHEAGAIIVASAGNGGGLNPPDFYVNYPAACDNVLAVGSFGLDESSARIPSDFNSFLTPPDGEGLDFLAPGETVFGLVRPDYDQDGSGSFYPPGYTFWDGTSMAAPSAAAALALLWRAAPFLTNAQLEQLVMSTATAAGPHTGEGYLDLNAAYAELKSDYPRLAATTILPADTSGRAATLKWTAVAGQSVVYDVSLDGSLVGEGVSATSLAVSGLSYGPHDVVVQPKSPRNWWGPDASASGSFDLPDPSLDDTTAPTVVSDTSDTYDDSAVVSLTATDEAGGSGVAYVAYKLDGGPTQTSPGASATVTTSTLGSHTLEYWAGDQAGNESTPAVDTFEVIDATPPTVSSDAKSSYVGEARIAISADDAGSGVVSVTYRLDGGTAVTTAGDSVTVPVLGKGSRTLEFWATDAASNESSHATKAFTIAPPTPERLAGDDRFLTAERIAREAFDPAGDGGWPSVSTVIVASGEDRAAADPLAAAGLVWAEDAPLLLVTSRGVPASTARVISEIRAQRAGSPIDVVIVGGTVAVPKAVEDTLRPIAGKTPTRVAGSDRYDTAARIAGVVDARHTELGGDTESVLVANGANPASFYDALSLSPVAARRGYPILLVAKASVPNATGSALGLLAPDSVVVAGGTATVAQSVVPKLESASGGASVDRWAGTDRYGTAATIASQATARSWLSPGTVGVASALPDALSGGSLAGRDGGVLLLTQQDVLPSVTRGWIEGRNDEIAACYIFGGENVVTPGVTAQIEAALLK